MKVSGEREPIAIGERCQRAEGLIGHARSQRHRRATRALLCRYPRNAPDGVPAVANDPARRIGDLGDVAGEVIGVGNGVDDRRRCLRLPGDLAEDVENLVF